MKKFLLMMFFIIAGVAYMHAQETYTTSKKTTVTTEKYNKNKIVALQWGNLRIESYSTFMQVYRYESGKWVSHQYIPRDTPKTYRFEKTYVTICHSHHCRDCIGCQRRSRRFGNF